VLTTQLQGLLRLPFENQSLRDRLKQLGFVQGSRMRLYGSLYELVSEPIVITENVVFVDAIEMKSGKLRRVRVPLPILKMANVSLSAA
jgi:hypothetical protein